MLPLGVSNLVNASFQIANPTSTIAPTFGGFLALDVGVIAGNVTTWVCGQIVPINSPTNGRRRLLQSDAPIPTANVYMFPQGAVVASTAVADFDAGLNNLTADGPNGTYLAPQSGAFIVLPLVGVAPVPGSSSSGGLGGGAIAGIVIGAVAALLCCLLLLFMFLLRYFSRNQYDDSTPPSTPLQAEERRPVASRPEQSRDEFSVPVAPVAGGAGAATTVEDYTESPEVSEVDPDQSSQMHIHV